MLESPPPELIVICSNLFSLRKINFPIDSRIYSIALKKALQSLIHVEVVSSMKYDTWKEKASLLKLICMDDEKSDRLIIFIR